MPFETGILTTKLYRPRVSGELVPRVLHTVFPALELKTRSLLEAPVLPAAPLLAQRLTYKEKSREPWCRLAMRLRSVTPGGLARILLIVGALATARPRAAATADSTLNRMKPAENGENGW